MFRHQYPTRACVIGKTTLRSANEVRSLWDNGPTPSRVGMEMRVEVPTASTRR